MNGKESKDRKEAVKPRPPWPRKRWQLIVLCAGLFVCGGLVGSSVTAGTMHRLMIKSLRNPDEVPTRMLSRMRRDLDLSDEQAEKVLAILGAKNETMARTFRETLASGHNEVRELLNEEQAARWDERVARMKEHIFGAGEAESEREPQ